MSKSAGILALALCAYLAAPLYPVPIVGVSWSLLLLALLYAQALRARSTFRIRRSTSLGLFLATLTFAVFASFAYNVLSDDGITELGEASKYVAQFLVFGFTCLMANTLFSVQHFPEKALTAFAGGVGVMSIFVLMEYFVLGGLRGDGWSHVTRMSQNSYAVQYSAFLPFVYGTLIQSRRKLLWTLVLALCLAAVLVNSSRTAWGTTLLSGTAFCLIFGYSKRKLGQAFLALTLIGTCGGVLWMALPERITEGIISEANTFEDLEHDKSWMIRQLQIQKAMLIFEEAPILGVGPGQFRYQSLALDLPDVLSGRSAFQFSDVSAHNSYIQFLAETGLAFMVPFIALLAWLLVKGTASALYLLKAGEVWPLCLIVSLLSMSVHFWTIAGLTSTGPWFIYGAVAAMIMHARRTRALKVRSGVLAGLARSHANEPRLTR